jgi:hypothetical protein
VPVLARTIEAAGIPTVTVSMMPIMSDKYRSSRILGVEYPFGHSFGAVGDREMQRRTLWAALQLLVAAPRPGGRFDLAEQWPGDAREAYKNWQPDEPSPIVLHSIEMIRQAQAGAKQSSD